MSKIICDICGTTYPETASACPICGYAKNTTEPTAAEDSEVTAVYTPVKGGRFSKSNVRKRNKKNGNSIAATKEPKQDNSNKGLVIVVLILMLAIVVVLCYIGMRFFLPDTKTDAGAPNNSSSSSVDQNSGNGDEQTPQGKPCTGLVLDTGEIEFSAANSKMQLGATKYPADTTDVLTFTSSHPAVATVDADGTITAVGAGETVITVTCGSASQECKIVCSFEDVPVPPGPDDDTPDNPVELPEGFKLELKYKDFTISKQYPNPVSIYKKNDTVKATDITWTSDDETVATIDEKGVVTAVGRGYTTVYGEIGDQKVACKVNVAFDPETVEKPKYTISHTDVTLTIGGADTFSLNLKDENQANVQDVVWTANEEGYVTIDGRTIKAVKVTSDLQNRYVILSATVEDYTYTCKVRIVEAKTEE